MIRIDTDPNRIDWFQVLTDLGRKGVPVPSVASAIHAPKSTVYGWKQGAEPKHIDGERLIALWVRLTGREPAQVPRAGTGVLPRNHGRL